MSTDNITPQEIVVVDPNVSDYKTLIAGLSPDIPVVILPEDGDGLSNLAQALSGYENLNAVHLVTHGSRGQLLLGDDPVDSETLSTHPTELQQIADTLAPGADLMLYGCSVANGDEGEAFINQLSASLGYIDIAASDDRTGPLSLGGDWDLEYSEGEIETVLPFTVQGMQDIDHCLGCQNGVENPTYLTDDGTCNNGRGDPSPSNNAPVFLSTASFSVDENTANSTTLHDVNANNGDGGNADDGVTYSITSGNNDSDLDGNLPFAINSSTGVITLNDTGDLDAEDGNTSYTLVVQANDGQASNNTTNQTITVTVTGSGTGDTFDFESMTDGDKSFDTSSLTFTITGNMTGQTDTDYGSNPVGSNGNTDGYMDASGTGVVGGIAGPDGYTFRAFMFDVWPSTDSGANVATEGQSVTVIGKLDGVEVISETFTTFDYGQTPEAKGGPWQRIDLTGTDFLTTDIDEVEFSISGDLDYLAVDNFVYDNLGVANPNSAPTLTTVDNVTAGSEDSEKEISFADLQGLADDQDSDGTVDSFAVKAVSSGTLKIGTDAGSATAWAENTNDLIDATHKAFWTPAADANGDLNAFTVVAVDDDSAESTSPVQVVVEVATANDAPVLDNSANPTLDAIDEDPASNDGTLVSDLLGAHLTDVDSGADEGIAITATGTSNGGWEYSVNGGTDWTDIGTVSANSALLLVADADTRIRFNPNTDFNGSATISYRGWDQTSGSAATKVDVSTNGTDTAFSSAEESASITVNAVNDDPTFTGLPSTITVNEDTAGDVDLSAATLGDADADPLNDDISIKLVTSAGTLTAGSSGDVDASGSGSGQLTLTGTLDNLHAYLDTASAIQYTGASDVDGDDAATLTVKVNDNGVSGSGGGNDVTMGTISVDITADNDAPTLSNLDGDAVNFSIGGNAVSLDADSDLTLADVDSSDFDGGTVTVSLTDGENAEDTLQVGDLGNITVSGSTVSHSDGVNIGTVSGSNNGVDLTISLSSDATLDRVEDLLGALQYQDIDNSTTNTADRTVSITVSDGDGDTSSAQQVTVSLVRAPIIDLDGDDSSTATAGNFTTTFTEGTAVALADSDSSISDDGSFQSLTVTLNSRPDGAAESLLSSYGEDAQTVNGEAVTIGAYNSNDGTLTVTINDGDTDADTLQLLIESIRYDNSADDPDTTNRTITFTATDNDNNTGSAVTTTVAITDINDQPTLSANGATPTFIEDSGSNAGLFSSAAIDTVESGQTVQQLVITVGNVTDGSSDSGDQEFLVIDGTDVALNDGNSTTTTNSHSVAVSLDNSNTATVTLTGNNLSATDAETLINALAYSNSSDAPTTTANREVNISSIQDSGGTDNGGVDADNSLSGNTATVTLQGTNDTPTASDTTETVAYNGSYAFTVDDFGFNDPDGDTLQQLYIGSLPDKGVLKLGDNEVSLNDHTGIAEIDATDIEAGQLTYDPDNGGTGNSYSSFTFTVSDGSEESAAPNTVTLNVGAPPSSGGRSSGGNSNSGSSTETIDGVTVEKDTSTDDDGNTTSTVTIDPISDNRQEDTGTDNGDKADIPLREEDDGNAALSVALPVGIGITAEGNDEAQSAGDSLADLIRLIDETADDDAESANKGEMLEGGEAFLEALQDENLWVNKITLTASTDNAPDAPIVISGNSQTNNNGNDNSQAALVIDASTLPSGTVLELQDVEFAVIVGPATITGGEGQNTIFAGAGSQTIILGPDDDQLYGGDGDDTVGSKGGDDLLFGENGDDTLFGGAGNDTMHGGADTDIVTYDGNLADYEVSQIDGVVRVTSKIDNTDSDTLVNVEQVQFADQTFSAEYGADLQTLATLYQHVLGRQADLDGFQWWADTLGSSQSTGEVVLGFMQSEEYRTASGVDFNGLDTNQQLDAFYLAILGRSADDQGKADWQAAIDSGMGMTEVASGFANSVELAGQYQQAEQWDFTL